MLIISSLCNLSLLQFLLKGAIQKGGLLSFTIIAIGCFALRLVCATGNSQLILRTTAFWQCV